LILTNSHILTIEYKGVRQKAYEFKLKIPEPLKKEVRKRHE